MTDFKCCECGHELNKCSTCRDHWIDIKKRKPEPGQFTLVAIDYGDKHIISMARYVSPDFTTWDVGVGVKYGNYWTGHDITHWQPLPEPPT
jgi:hypothetical protein